MCGELCASLFSMSQPLSLVVASMTRLSMRHQRTMMLMCLSYTRHERVSSIHLRVSTPPNERIERFKKFRHLPER